MRVFVVLSCAFLLFNAALAQDCRDIKQELADQQVQLEFYKQEQEALQESFVELQQAVEQATIKNKKNWLWITGGVVTAITAIVMGVQTVKAIKLKSLGQKVNIIKALLGVGAGAGSYFLIRKAYLNAKELAQLEFELGEAVKIIDEEKLSITNAQDKIKEFQDNLNRFCQL